MTLLYDQIEVCPSCLEDFDYEYQEEEDQKTSASSKAFISRYVKPKRRQEKIRRKGLVEEKTKGRVQPPSLGPLLQKGRPRTYQDIIHGRMKEEGEGGIEVEDWRSKILQKKHFAQSRDEHGSHKEAKENMLEHTQEPDRWEQEQEKMWKNERWKQEQEERWKEEQEKRWKQDHEERWKQEQEQEQEKRWKKKQEQEERWKQGQEVKWKQEMEREDQDPLYSVLESSDTWSGSTDWIANG